MRGGWQEQDGPSQGNHGALTETRLEIGLNMAKIDIKETSEGTVMMAGKKGGGRSPSSKSPSPARRDAAPYQGASASSDSVSDPNKREGVSNESGYFEDEEEGGELREENSIEIIFDKNATNNNLGNKAAESNKTGRNNAIIYVLISGL